LELREGTTTTGTLIPFDNGPGQVTRDLRSRVKQLCYFLVSDTCHSAFARCGTVIPRDILKLSVLVWVLLAGGSTELSGGPPTLEPSDSRQSSGPPALPEDDQGKTVGPPDVGKETDTAAREGQGQDRREHSDSRWEADRSSTDSSSSNEPQPSSFLTALVHWLGRFHPVTVHFPIALLVSALLAELLGKATGKTGFRFAAHYCLGLGALSAVLAVLLGWFLAGLHWQDATLTRTAHRWFGTATMILASITFVFSTLNRRTESRRVRRAYWGTLIGGAALVGATGAMGGAMVYGWDHYQWPTTTSAQTNTAADAAVRVLMTDEFLYEPEVVSISVGDTVRWEGVGSYAHTVTADPAKAAESASVRLPAGAQPFDSGRIQPGETFAYTFRTPGRYRYFCIPHEAAGMVGEVVVEPAGNP